MPLFGGISIRLGVHVVGIVEAEIGARFVVPDGVLAAAIFDGLFMVIGRWWCGGWLVGDGNDDDDDGGI